jgi:pimeloyl-ACP methyl ester carboxylesterase
MNPRTESLQTRVHPAAGAPTLVYLPGIHGDWTLVGSFRAAVAGRAQFVEFTYPRTLTWSVADYADAIAPALLERGIERGWLIGESFGSLIAWELLRPERRTRTPHFLPLGLMLAGGFVKHPLPGGARLLRRLGEALPMGPYRALLRGYALFARFRHRHAPETLASLEEFVARRTALDRQAMRARLELVARADYREVARRTHRPVWYLAGLVDPLVPWPWVRAWLRRNCPGYRGGRTFWLADHNVLSTASRAAAQQVFRWLEALPAAER